MTATATETPTAALRVSSNRTLYSKFIPNWFVWIALTNWLYRNICMVRAYPIRAIGFFSSLPLNQPKSRTEWICLLFRMCVCVLSFVVHLMPGVNCITTGIVFIIIHHFDCRPCDNKFTRRDWTCYRHGALSLRLLSYWNWQANSFQVQLENFNNFTSKLCDNRKRIFTIVIFIHQTDYSNCELKINGSTNQLEKKNKRPVK